MNDSADKSRRDDWVDAAYSALVTSGVEAVKILPLAKALKTSRTSFYWCFSDRDALLAALIERWKGKNTQGLERQAERYAATVVEATLNVFDCWLDESIFDSEFEFAVRHWALNNAQVAAEVAAADQRRLTALTTMLTRFGYAESEASVRAHTLYLTQIGYISMRTRQTKDERIRRVADYVLVFTGEPCQRDDLARFASRHTGCLATWMNDFGATPEKTSRPVTAPGA